MKKIVTDIEAIISDMYYYFDCYNQNNRGSIDAQDNTNIAMNRIIKVLSSKYVPGQEKRKRELTKESLEMLEGTYNNIKKRY